MIVPRAASTRRTLKKLPLLAMIALYAAVSPGVAAAGPTNDAVIGGGEHVESITQGISAHSGPAGEDARGNVTITQQGGGLLGRGQVRCLIVAGNQAFVTWMVEDGDGIPQGTLVVTHVVDNGASDLIRNSFEGFIYPDFERPACWLPILEPVPVTKGNYV